MLRLGGYGGPPGFGSCGGESERPPPGSWRSPVGDVESEMCTLRTAVEASQRGLSQLEMKLVNKLDQACRRQVEDALASHGPLAEFRQSLVKLQSESRHLATELGRLPCARDVDDALVRHRETLEARVGERVAALEDGINRQHQAAMERLEGRGGETWRSCLHRMASLEEKAVLQTDIGRIVDRTLAEVRKAGTELFGAGAVTGPAALAEVRKEMRRMEAKVAGLEARILGIAEDSTTEGRIWRASLCAKVEALERALQEHSGRVAGEDARRLASEDNVKQICEAAEMASQKVLEQALQAAEEAKQAGSDKFANMQASLLEQLAALEDKGRSRDAAVDRECKELAGRFTLQEEGLKQCREKASQIDQELEELTSRLATAVSKDVAGLQVRATAQEERFLEQEAAQSDLSRKFRDLKHSLEVKHEEIRVAVDEHKKQLTSKLNALGTSAAEERAGRASPGETAASFFAAASAVRQSPVAEPAVPGASPPTLSRPGRPASLQSVSAPPSEAGKVAASPGTKAASSRRSPQAESPAANAAASVAASPHSESGSRQAVAAAAGSPAAASPHSESGSRQAIAAAAGSPAAASPHSESGSRQAVAAAAGSPAAASPHSESGSRQAVAAAAGSPAAASPHSESGSRQAAAAAAGSPAAASPVQSDAASRQSSGMEVAKPVVSQSPAASQVASKAGLSAASSQALGASPRASLGASPAASVRSDAAAGPPDILRFTSPNWQKECDGFYELVPDKFAQGRPIWKKRGGERWLYLNTDRNWGVGGQSEFEKGFDCKNSFIFNARTAGAASPDLLTSGWTLFDGQAWREDPDVLATALPLSPGRTPGSASGAKAGDLARAALAGEMQTTEGKEVVASPSARSSEPSSASAVASLMKQAVGKVSSPVSPSQEGQAVTQPGVSSSPSAVAEASPVDVSAIGAVTSFHQEASSLSQSPGIAPAAGSTSADEVVKPKAEGADLADSILAGVAGASDDEGGNSWDGGSASASFDDGQRGGGSSAAASPKASPRPQSGPSVGIGGAAGTAASPPLSGRSRFNSLAPVSEGQAQATVPPEDPGANDQSIADGEEDAPFDASAASSDWDEATGSARSFDPAAGRISSVAPPVERPQGAVAQPTPPAQAKAAASSRAREAMADLGFDSEDSNAKSSQAAAQKAPQSTRDAMADLGFDSEDSGKKPVTAAAKQEAPSSARSNKDVMADLGFESDAGDAPPDENSGSDWDD